MLQAQISLANSTKARPSSVFIPALPFRNPDLLGESPWGLTVLLCLPLLVEEQHGLRSKRSALPMPRTCARKAPGGADKDICMSCGHARTPSSKSSTIQIP